MSQSERGHNRFLSTIVIFFLKLYTAATSRPRVRVLVLNERNEVLLIKGVISKGEWSLPGGGVESDELLIDAAKRELYEETGIMISDDDIRYVRTPSKTELPIAFTAPLFQAWAKRASLPKKLHNSREIAAAGWFDSDHLPTPLSSVATLAITELVKR